MTDQQALRTGTVTEFDGARGYGEVVEQGDRRWRFHSTAIADGTRSIEVGATVVFRVVPGRAGRFEAGWVRPVGA